MEWNVHYITKAFTLNKDTITEKGGLRLLGKSKCWGNTRFDDVIKTTKFTKQWLGDCWSC